MGVDLLGESSPWKKSKALSMEKLRYVKSKEVRLRGGGG